MKTKQVKSTAEIKSVVKLAKEIWEEHYIPIIGKEQVDYMLDKYQSQKAISDQIQNRNYIYYLLEDEKINFGYLGIQIQKNKLFLSKIYIKSTHRGSGFGRESLEFIFNFAKNNNFNKVYLTVNKNNINSINAYKKIGFQCIDSVVTDIGNGFVMDDYILEKTLKEEF